MVDIPIVQCYIPGVGLGVLVLEAEDYSPHQADRIWLEVYYNKILINPHILST